jgi:2-polyprenyl-3-methyl-5-hydroxy-6-metoxy-1,4-benzoquinol methylase
MTSKTQALLYDTALERLETLDRRLAMAAQVVCMLHPSAATVAESVLAFASSRFSDRDVVETYVARAQRLVELQQRFDADPRPATIGSPGAAVSRDVYNLSLLLSIPFTNHRFEIMEQLDRFLAGCEGPTGSIVSVGTGTGYELRQMAAIIPADWTVESYDIDESVQYEARQYLDFFGVSRAIRWGREFPLTVAASAFAGRYDAIVMCELLEHLADPAAALRAVRTYLTPRGRVFVTMAVNIAQEDHVFLYPNLATCRDQVHATGFEILSEWITPQSTLPPPADRERGFKKGNYVAVLRPAGIGPMVGGTVP